MKWGDEWLPHENGPPVRLRHKTCNKLLHPSAICEACRREVRAEDISINPPKCQGSCTGRRRASEIAVDAYCDCEGELLDGSLKAAHPLDGRDLIDAQTPPHRVLQIASANRCVCYVTSIITSGNANTPTAMIAEMGSAMLLENTR
jgi:hypothetical protein